MIRAVIFDMDGVLIDSEPSYNVAEAAMLAQFGLPFGPREITAITGASYRTLGQTIRGWLPDVKATDAEIQKMYLDGLLGALQQEVKTLIPGVLPFIQTLHKKGITMGIGSASHEKMVQYVVSHFGLTDYMSAIVTGTDTAVGKPAPDIFLLAAERLGVPPAECLVIEDSLNGVKAALAAGMTCVAFLGTAHHGFDLSMAHLSIDSYADMSAVLALMESPVSQ